MSKKQNRRTRRSEITNPSELYRHLFSKLEEIGPMARISPDIQGEIASARGYIDDNRDAGYASWAYIFSNTIIDDGSVAASMLPECSWATLLFMGRLHDLRIGCSGEPILPAYILTLLMDQFRHGTGLSRSDHMSKNGGIAITGQLVVNSRKPPCVVKVLIKPGTMDGYNSVLWDPIDKMIFDFAMPANLAD